jgi:flagellar biosynthesis protein FlhF
MATIAQPQIHVKSYFATSVPDAIDQARRELGPDALFLNSRQAPPEARHLGPLEVVFGHDAGGRYLNDRHDLPLPGSQPSFSSLVPSSSPGPEDLKHNPGFEDLRQNIEKIWNLLVRTTRTGGWTPARPRLLEQVLLEIGLTSELAAEIDDAATTQAPGADASVLFSAATDEIRRRFEVRHGIGRITALVGPPGAGKTTTLVKLAVTEGLMKGRTVRLISADTQRIAASEQLRIYAAILGVSFQSVESVCALAQAVDSAPTNSLLLIDTPGLSPASLDGTSAEFAAFFRQRQDIDTHLVLTAVTGPKELQAASNRFAPFHPSALIFTKLDETVSPGGLFSEAARTGIPLSYFCHGQLVPEDIEAATTNRLTEHLERQLPLVLQSAA